MTLSVFGASTHAQAGATPSEPDRPELVLQTGQTSPAQTIAFSADGKLLASSGYAEMAVRVWETASGRQLALLTRHSASAEGLFSGVMALAFNRDGTLLAAGFGDDGVVIWQVSTGDELAAMPGSAASLRTMLGVRRILFSIDGKYLLTAHGDATKVWDLSTWTLAREIAVPASTMCASAAFASNGREVATIGRADVPGTVVRRTKGNAGGLNATVAFTDIASGKEVRAVDLADSISTMIAGTCLATTTDDRVLVATGGNEIKIWDVSSGTAPRAVANPFAKQQYSLQQALSSDGRMIALAQHNTLSVWDLSSSRVLFTSAIEKSSTSDMGNEIGSLEFSADGKYLATGSYDGKIQILDATSGKLIRKLEGPVNPSRRVTLDSAHGRLYSGQKTAWNLTSGRGEQILPNVQGTMGILSADGSILAEPSQNNGDVRIWNVPSGAQISTLAPGFEAVSSLVIFSPDARLAAVTYRAKMGSPSITQAPAIPPSAAALPPNLMRLPRGSDKGKKTSAADLQAMMQQAMQAAQARAAAVSGQSTDPAAQIKVFEIVSGKLIATIPARAAGGGYSATVDISPDGQSLAVATLAGIEIWTLATQSKVLTLAPSVGTGGGAGFISAMGNFTRQIQSLHYSPDGKYLAASLRDSSAMMMAGLGQSMSSGFSSVSAPRHRGIGIGGIGFPQLPHGAKPVGPVATSGMPAMTYKVAGPIEVWDITKGQRIVSLPGHANGAGALVYSADGKWLATTGADDEVKIWDLAAGKELRTLSGNTATMMDLAFDANNTVVAAACADGTTRLWDFKSGELLANLLSLYDGREWLVVTPDGLFDGSPAAWNQILWRFGGSIFDVSPVESFFNEFYYPDLLADIFSGKRPHASRDIAKIDRRQPHLVVTATGTPEGKPVASRELTVSLTVDAAPAGARDVRLFRNGSLVKIWHEDVLKGQDHTTLTANIPIVAGSNHLSAYAFNSANIKSVDVALEVIGADSLKREPVAFVLAVGINEYADKDYNLRYATSDAEAFGRQLRQELDKQKRFERIDMTVLSDQNATKNNILKAIEDLAERAQPEDELFVFVASHGTAAQDRFFLIPHDLGYVGSRSALDEQAVRTILQHSISDQDLERSFERLDAARILLVLDACNSGQALEADEKRRGPMNSRGLAQLAYEKGMYILTAAQSYQAAQEVSRLGHGLLTYSLVVEGLENSMADFEPHDGQVMIREWLDYSVYRVPQMQLEAMEQSRRSGRNLSFGSRSRGDTDSPQDASENIQQPKMFYRRELENNQWVVSQRKD